MNFVYVEETRIINERFEKIYGRHTVKNLANFRLVFAEDQVEKRSGTFSVYHGDIFLREETGIREVPKYPYAPSGSWMVERLVANTHTDVLDGDYVYEPIYCFKIFPIWRACEFLIQSLFSPNDNPKTQKEAEYQDEMKKEKEKADILNQLGSTDSAAIESALRDKSAVSFANSKDIDYRPSLLGDKSE